MKYIIIDWAGNLQFKDKKFNSIEDGLDFLYDNTDEDEHDEYIVCEDKVENITQLNIIDMLEGRSFRAQI